MFVLFVSVIFVVFSDSRESVVDMGSLLYHMMMRLIL